MRPPLPLPFLQVACRRAQWAKWASRVGGVALTLIAAALIALPVSTFLDRAEATTSGAAVSAPVVATGPVVVDAAGAQVRVVGAHAQVGQTLEVTIATDGSRAWLTHDLTPPGRHRIWVRVAAALAGVVATFALALAWMSAHPSSRAHPVTPRRPTAARVQHARRVRGWPGARAVTVVTGDGTTVTGRVPRGGLETGEAVTLLHDPARERAAATLVVMRLGGPLCLPVLPPRR